MTRRNASVAKIVAAAVAILAVVYLFYIFNQTSGKLKDTERVANRYRREQEALSSQLSDLRSEKDTLQQRCDSEKKEYQTRLSSANQQYKMLQSQNEDLQSDFGRLRGDCNKDKEDHKLHDAQQNQEYMQLKQEKELEISSLKDEVANIKREKESLDTELIKLRADLETSQRNWKLENKERLSLETQVGYLKKQAASYQYSVSSLQEQNKDLQGLTLEKSDNETQLSNLKAQHNQNLQLQNLHQQNLQQNVQQQNLPQQQQQNIQQSNQEQPVVNGNIVNNLQNVANQVGGKIHNVANQFVGNLQHAANNLGAGDWVDTLGSRANQLMHNKENLAQMEQKQIPVVKSEKEKAEEIEKKNKIIEEIQQQHQVLPPNKKIDDEDVKLNAKVQQQPATNHPNLHAPELKGQDSDLNANEKGHINENIGRPVHQVQPPVVDLFKNGERNKHDLNVQPPDGVVGLNPNEVNQQQNIPPPKVNNLDLNVKPQDAVAGLNPNDVNQQLNIPPPKVGKDIQTEKQPMVGGDVQQVNIPPPKRMEEEVPKLLDILKKNGVQQQPAMPEM